MALAMIVIPFVIPVNDHDEALDFCIELDKIVKNNFFASLDRQGADSANLPEPMNTLILGYIDLDKYPQ